MTPEITELIKNKAEERAKEYEKGSWEHFLLSEAYKDGQVEAIEMMIGFTEWMADNDVTLWSKNDLGGNKTHQLEYDDRFYTTIELLTKYIKEVLPKTS